MSSSIPIPIPQIAESGVGGRDNPANLYTKYLDWDSIRRHSARVSADFMGGRALSAPELHEAKALWDTDKLDTEHGRIHVTFSTNPKSSTRASRNIGAVFANTDSRS